MKIFLFTAQNPLRAYSGIKYMCSALQSQGHDVTLFAKIPKEMYHESKKWNFTTKQLVNNLLVGMPVVRRLYTTLLILYKSIFSSDLVIFHDLSYVREMVFAKKIRKNLKIVHYLNELFTIDEEPALANLINFYADNAELPDLIIECDHSRAQLRAVNYKIQKYIYVIPNTLPLSELANTTAKENLAKLCGLTSFPSGKKVLLYTGGAFLHRELDLIIDAISLCKTPVFFVAFCYGESKAIDFLKEYCAAKLGDGNFSVNGSIERERLLSCANQADAGIVYYKPSLTVGNLFASPTKFFEYVAVGLPVISSNNPNLVKIIDDYKIGSYTKGEKVIDLSEAIDRLFQDEDIDAIRKNCLTSFANRLSYEMTTQEVYDQFRKILER